MTEKITDKILETFETKKAAIETIASALKQGGFTVVEVETEKPWGGYIRLDNNDAESFVKEYFPGMPYEEACLGDNSIELSPKILYVEPRQRLSWQKHDRRAERWRFITPGAYYKSSTDDMGELEYAAADQVVQFAQGERHRLVSPGEEQVVVAEIWQHTQPNNPSDEADIVRIEDDYAR